LDKIAKNHYPYFKKALKNKNLYLTPGCHDPLTAKLIEKENFQFIFIGGFALSSGQYGYPDAGLITLSELADSTRKIQRSTNIPCIVDADTGFGGTINIYRTVRDLAEIGVAALIIEDQEFPKKCALTEKVKILNFKESCKRIKAAVKASKENKKQDIGIIARTDAYPVLGIKETVKRIKAFKSLGADVIFSTGIDTKEDLEAISKYKNLNLMLNITQNVEFSIKDLKKCGIKFAIYSQSILNGYIDTTKNILKTIKQESIPRSKNLSNDTLNILDFQKVLKIEKN
jgi:2-methylisocitrate lyase-like PEP mutase family enzyme